MTYRPYTLSCSACCAYEHVVIKQKRDGATLHSARCTGLPGTRRFCVKHEYVLEMLDVASRAGYPEIQVEVNGEMTALCIGPSVMDWEAYAVRHARTRHFSILAQLSRIIQSQDQQNKVAILLATRKCM